VSERKWVFLKKTASSSVKAGRIILAVMDK
jgi:hypothetical protein